MLDACGGPLPRLPLEASKSASLAPGGSPAPSALGGPSVPPPAPADDHEIVVENRRPGSLGWDLRGLPEATRSWVFALDASIVAGEPLRLQVAAPSLVDVEIYRLGWYGGRGGRLVQTERAVDVAPADATEIDPITGQAEARGGATVTIQTEASWTSGIHVAVIRSAVTRPVRRADAFEPPTATPFTIRARTPSSVLFVSATATWQAYNEWGGADLYGATPGNSPLATGGARAVRVSLDRPYQVEHGLGLMPRWELDFVRWQEREGRRVDYAVDVDLETHPEITKGRRLILFVGHHEYWSRPMRATLETATASGTNVAFLSADEIAWQVRFDPSPSGSARRMTCYKSSVLDPMATSNPPLTTCHWRDVPVRDPEATIIGEMYGHVVRRPADWVVVGSRHWLYEGTGLRDGDRIINLVGQEYDTFFPGLAPPGTVLLARSPVVPDLHREAASEFAPLDAALQTATAYEAESGATVMAAGTFQWSWALDRWGDRSLRGVVTPVDERVARMTRNLFDRLGDGPAEA